MYLCDSIIPSVPLSPSLFSIFRVLLPIPRFVHYVPFSLREYPFVSPSFLSHTQTHTSARTHANTQAHIRTHAHSLSLFFSLSLSLVFLFVFFFLLFCLIVTEKYAVENLRAAVQNRARVFSFISPRALQTRELKGPFFNTLLSFFFFFLLLALNSAPRRK